MLEEKKEKGKKKNHQTCQHTVPALNLFPISSNLWEPGLWSLILFSSVPPTTSPSSVSHFQFHLLPPLCDFHLISLLKFKIYSRGFLSWIHAGAAEPLFVLQIWNCKSAACLLGRGSPKFPGITFHRSAGLKC